MSRKNYLITKLVIWVLLLLILMVSAVRMFIYSGSGFWFLGGWQKDPILQESYTGVRSVEVSTTSFSIVIEEQDSDSTLVEFYATENDKTLVNVSCTGGVLKIKQATRIGLFNGSGRLVILVPRGSALDYSILNTSGSIRLSANSKSVAATTTSGSIRIWGEGERVSALTTSGSIRIFDPFREIAAESTSGSIRATADASTRSVDLSCTSGSIRLSLPEDLGYSMSYQSTTGSVKDLYHDIKFGNYGQYTHGDGAISLNLQTVSGSIKLCNWTD